MSSCARWRCGFRLWRWIRREKPKVFDSKPNIFDAKDAKEKERSQKKSDKCLNQIPMKIFGNVCALLRPLRFHFGFELYAPAKPKIFDAKDAKKKERRPQRKTR